jgi:hypothetical protein
MPEQIINCSQQFMCIFTVAGQRLGEHIPEAVNAGTARKPDGF